MKKLLLLLIFPLFLGSTSKYEYKYEVPFAPILYAGINDSIPTIDKFGRIRNGIIAQKIIDTLNTDPSGVKLNRAELDYIRSIVGGLYVTGMWQKSVAIYGFVGGNAFKHKWNWKDIRDLDAAFRLSFVGAGWTHSSTGSKPNGTVYANTFLNPSTKLTLNSTHISMYSGTNITTDVYSIVALDGVNNFGLYANFNGNIFNTQYNSGNGRILSSETRGDGYFLINRQSSSSNSTYRNGVLKGFSSVSTSIGSLPNINMLLGAVDVANPNDRGLKEYRLVSIGSGLTDQQAITSSQVITYSQGILNRK